MRRPASPRKALTILAISSVVFAAGAASAWSSTTTTTTTSTSTTTATRTTPTTTGLAPGVDPNSPAALFLVLNGTVNAASDHEVLGSSAFPNYTTGAVDNYYSKAHAHVDNAPFAEGTASPADTGPVGQTAAAGNFQQPQYADARWPGDSGKATYGTQGQPYAVASAASYAASAEASVASSGLGGPSGTSGLAVPKGFDTKLRTALAAWNAKWLDRLYPKKARATAPTPTVTVPTPVVTVTTPPVTVATPTVTLGGLTTAPAATVPSVTVPSVSVPSGITPKAAPSRSLQSSSAPPDGASLLHSTGQTTFDAATHALVTTGESSLGRVSIGGGQIVLEGIHVSAQITNDGTPTDKEAVSVASASVGGIPVTIDQDGVHVAGHDAGVPYQQASDALNGALKAAGIQLFLVAPEVTRGSSDGQSGTTTDTTTTDTTSTDTTTTTSTGTTSFGTGTCTPTGTSTTDTSTDMTTTTDTTTTDTTTTDTTSTTTTGPTLPFGTSGQGGGTGMSPNEEIVRATGVHVVFTQPVDAPGVPAQFAEHILGEVSLDSLAVPAGAGLSFSGGLNLNLGLGNLGGLGGLGSGSASGTCGVAGRHSGKTTKSAGLAKVGGGSTGGGSTLAGSSSAAGSPSGFASGSAQPTSGVLSGSAVQPTSSPVGDASPAARLVSMLLKKPLWLLLAYLVWQGLMLVTGLSVWRWYRGEPS